MLNPFDVLTIDEHKITSISKCSISINKSDYGDDSLIETESAIYVPGILNVFIDHLDDYAPVMLNYTVRVNKTSNIEETSDTIVIKYDEDQIILTQETKQAIFGIGLLVKILNGRLSYIDDPIILLKLLADSLGTSDLVHAEIIISNMIRDEQNTDLLSRYKKVYGKDNVIVGVTNQAKSDSLMTSLAFRDINRSIENALISGKTNQSNPIDKILNSQFD